MPDSKSSLPLDDLSLAHRGLIEAHLTIVQMQRDLLRQAYAQNQGATAVEMKGVLPLPHNPLLDSGPDESSFRTEVPHAANPVPSSREPGSMGTNFRDHLFSISLIGVLIVLIIVVSVHPFNGVEQIKKQYRKQLSDSANALTQNQHELTETQKALQQSQQALLNTQKSLEDAQKTIGDLKETIAQTDMSPGKTDGPERRTAPIPPSIPEQAMQTSQGPAERLKTAYSDFQGVVKSLEQNQKEMLETADTLAKVKKEAAFINYQKAIVSNQNTDRPSEKLEAYMPSYATAEEQGKFMSIANDAIQLRDFIEAIGSKSASEIDSAQEQIEKLIDRGNSRLRTTQMRIRSLQEEIIREQKELHSASQPEEIKLLSR